MKPRFATSIIAIVFLIVAAGLAYQLLAISATSTTITTSRFALFGGRYEVNTGTEHQKKEDGVFKLDSYSGKTWKLKVIDTDNGQKTSWEEIPDSK